MKFIKSLIFASAAVLAVSCGSASTFTTEDGYKFPVYDQQAHIAIVAHRGFWNCEAGGFSENSIASLKAAQDNGLWGSECDIQLTADGVVIVNHNPEIDGLLIREHNWDELKTHLLPNGERRPLLEEYLAQAKQCKTTKLIIELKKQKLTEKEDELLDKTIAALKACKMYNPDRVVFITFSEHMCERLAAEQPKFVNQFLTSNKKKDMDPKQFAKKGINGIDYLYNLFFVHPEWVKTAHKLGMSVNAWTVDKKEDIVATAALGVDQITSNEPLLVRQILGPAEYKLAK